MRVQGLYEYCSHLIFDDSIGCYLSTNPVVALLSMAVLNNHANVNYELSDFEKSRDLSIKLMHVASVIKPSVYGNERDAAIVTQAKEMFLLNTLVLRCPPILARAA